MSEPSKVSLEAAKNWLAQEPSVVYDRICDGPQNRLAHLLETMMLKAALEAAKYCHEREDGWCEHKCSELTHLSVCAFITNLERQLAERK